MEGRGDGFPWWPFPGCAVGDGVGVGAGLGVGDGVGVGAGVGVFGQEGGELAFSGLARVPRIAS